MQKIPLSQGKFALVDDEDYDWLSQWKWSLKKAGTKVYAFRQRRKSEETLGLPCTVYMHRVLCAAKRVDHKDGDGLNNQKENLRPCTVSQNCWNVGKFSTNTSGHKGAFWHKGTNKWRAQISCNGKSKHLGYFDSVEEAAEAYKEAAKRLHGEFAKC